MKNVAEMVRLMLMPQSSAAVRSWAVERIALPNRVRRTNSPSANIRNSAIPTTKMSVHATLTPPTVKAVPVIQSAWLVATLSGPSITSMMPSMRNETPIAVMSGASRGESRSRRYATNSMTTPVMPAASMESGNTMMSARRSPPKLPVASELRWNVLAMKTA